jgi:iron complex transport system substrate-binding protein
MRIVSLLPAATEIVCLLGLRDALVGRSHVCDYPADVAALPAVTRSTLADNTSAAEIDREVSAQLSATGAVFAVDTAALNALQPDVILTQDICAACAITGMTVTNIAAQMPNAPRVLSLNASTLEGMLTTIAQVGEACGAQAQAAQTVAALRARLDEVRNRVRDVRHRPGVAALEWLEPPFAPGHWVPEQIEAAGGRAALGEAGQAAVRITWDDVSWVQPEMVLLMPCGYGVDDITEQFERIAAGEVWRDLPATYLNQIYAVDADSHFSRPGPRLIDGVEVLATLLHPNLFGRPESSAAQRLSHLVRTRLRDS